MRTRIVKKPAVRRDEILDAVGKLIFTKGYEQMTIQDILDDLNIAKGTVYHYFDSKQGLLNAFIERMKQVSERALLPILDDPDRNAIEKLQGFLDALDSLRTGQKAEIVKLIRVWYTDDNAIVRQKVEAAAVQQRAPLLIAIVRQGIQEGVFTTPYPDQAGEIILSLLQGMGNSHVHLLFACGQALDEQACIESIVSIHAAYLHAIERVLGAPPSSLNRVSFKAAQAWVNAFQQSA